MKILKLLKILAIIIVLLLACIGLLFTGVFVGMQFGLFNVPGSIEARNNSILFASGAAGSLASLFIHGTSDNTSINDYSCADGRATCPWAETREWAVVAGGLAKDLPIIERVAAETGVSPRLIAAVVVPEQIRFFTADREVFKRYFEPLKILGSLSKFSLGVSGIKQDTARAVEEHATNANSPLYPGEGYARLLAYSAGADRDAELFKRLTDEKNHYYSYLYTAVFIKEVLVQWERAGYDLGDRPEIVATIFNLGFTGSTPKQGPQVGGSTITVGGQNYSFGGLAGAFYRSGQLPSLRIGL